MNTDEDSRVRAGADLRVAMESALSAKQMSVSALGREARVQRGDIYRWWRGETRPSRNTLARVAPVLGVEVGVLHEALGQMSPNVTPKLIDEIEDRLRRVLREELGAFLRPLDDPVDLTPAVESGQTEGERRLRSPKREAPDRPPRSPARRARAE